MLFLRVLGINYSTVAAQATTNVRFVTMMIVVDRSGSVQRAGNAAVIQTPSRNLSPTRTRRYSWTVAT